MKIHRFFFLIFFLIFNFIIIFSESEINFNKLYSEYKFDKILYLYDNKTKEYDLDDIFIIANTLNRKGRKKEAKNLYEELLEKNYSNENYLYKLWNILDEKEKNKFFKFTLKNYPNNNFIIHRYLDYLETNRKYDRLIYFIEKNVINFNNPNINYVKKLINLYLQRGIFEDKYSYFKEKNSIFTLYLSIVADDRSYLASNFQNVDSRIKDKLIRFILQNRKFLFLKGFKNNLNQEKYTILFEVLNEDSEVDFSKTSKNDLKFILNSCMEYEKFEKADEILNKINVKDNEFLIIRAKLAIFKENYLKAFNLLKNKYKSDNYFNSRLMRDLLDKIDLKSVSLDNDKFLDRLINIMINKRNYNNIVKIIPKIKKDQKKIALLSLMKNRIKYEKWRELIKYINKETVIKRFAPMLVIHQDKYLSNNLEFIKDLQGLKNKNSLIGDVYFFLKKDNDNALKYYNKIKFKPEKFYKLFMYYLINHNYSEIKDILKKEVYKYKGFYILIGDYYILNKKEKRAIKYYNGALDNVPSMLRDELHRRFYFYHKGNFDKLRTQLTILNERKNYIIWR